MIKDQTKRQSNEEPHVVILGGGFAGLSAAKKLARAKVRITLIDKENHHLFQPLLYQVATAGNSKKAIGRRSTVRILTVG